MPSVQKVGHLGRFHGIERLAVAGLNGGQVDTLRIKRLDGTFLGRCLTKGGEAKSSHQQEFLHWFVPFCRCDTHPLRVKIRYHTFLITQICSVPVLFMNVDYISQRLIVVLYTINTIN